MPVIFSWFERRIIHMGYENTPPYGSSEEY